jgi:DHA1 family inner membrane transport protein
MLGSAAITLVTVVALGAASTLPVPTIALFTVLGLTGLSANSVLIALVIRFAGSAPTLASGLIPSAFNLGTAVGTGVASVGLTTGLGELAPVGIGAVGATLVLVVFGTLALLERRALRPTPTR